MGEIETQRYRFEGILLDSSVVSPTIFFVDTVQKLNIFWLNLFTPILLVLVFSFIILYFSS